MEDGTMAKGKKQSSQKSKNQDRLIGWLVSYGLDKRGFNFEIRSGRTFISPEESDGLRTLALTDKSLSKVHIVLNADNQHNLLAQDIFSESGSYLTRNGQNSEEQIEGPVSLSHGDWLRVGDKTRFQVCLIDGPSR